MYKEYLQKLALVADIIAPIKPESSSNTKEC